MRKGDIILKPVTSSNVNFVSNFLAVRLRNKFPTIILKISPQHKCVAAGVGTDSTANTLTWKLHFSGVRHLPKARFFAAVCDDFGSSVR